MEHEDDRTRGMKTERLNEMAYAYKNAGALLAGIEFGIFTAISEGARNVEQISDKTGIPEESIDRLLTVCKALDLVREVDGQYQNFNDVERYLVRSTRTYLGDFLVYQSKASYDNFKELAREIRGSGGPAPEKQARQTDSHAQPSVRQKYGVRQRHQPGYRYADERHYTSCAVR